MRNIKIAEEIKKIIVQSIITKVQCKTNCLITIKHVTINRHLSLSKIYYSIIGGEKYIKNSIHLIKKNIPLIKKNISKQLKLNKIPKLKLIYQPI